MDAIQTEQREDDARVTTQLRMTLDRDFVSKQCLELKLAQLKTELVAEIKCSKSTTYSELFRIASVVVVVVTLCGWLYINVIHDTLGH